MRRFGEEAAAFAQSVRDSYCPPAPRAAQELSVPFRCPYDPDHVFHALRGETATEQRQLQELVRGDAPVPSERIALVVERVRERLAQHMRICPSRPQVL